MQSPPASLIWIDPLGAPPFAVEPAKTPITIGRAESQDLVLPDRYVSRAHAALLWSDGWSLVDTSRHGTTVSTPAGTSELIKGRSRRLGDGDVLRMGRVRLRFYNPAAEETPFLGDNGPDGTPVPPLDRAPRDVLWELGRPLREGTDGEPASNREIAAALFIAEGTVRSHLQYLYKALGIPDDLNPYERRRLLAEKSRQVRQR